MRYQVKDPQGNLHFIEGPEGAKPEEIIAQAQKLIPTQQQGPDWKGVIGKALQESSFGPETISRKMVSSPTAQAKALPYLAGTAGGISPIPGGSTLGTVGGRQLSNLALKSYGRPDLIPSGFQQAVEAGGAALGDIAAIPPIKSAYFGKKIGEAEAQAGMANIEKMAPPSGMRTAVKMVQGLKNKMNQDTLTPLEARQIKPALDTIWKKGWLKGSEYSADLYDVTKRINAVLNQIPARQEAVQGMSRAMTIPRMMGKTVGWIPQNVKRGLSFGIGEGMGGGTAFELIRRLLGR